MCAEPRWKVLQERYQLVKLLQSGIIKTGSETWIAIDPYEVEYIVKVWPFLSGQANDLQRALWDLELRTLYRVSSSPGAEECITTVKDAGLDYEHKCFVVVMSGSGDAGFDSLYNILPQRRSYPWLSNVNEDSRLKLWQGLENIAKGIQLLHTQSVIHRNVDVSNIILQPGNGPGTMRLGGFEWSIRIGELNLNNLPNHWLVPSTNGRNESSNGYQPEYDWYGFGIVAARCLLPIEHLFNNMDGFRQEALIHEVERANNRQLSDLEKVFLFQLLAKHQSERTTQGYEILAEIDNIQDALKLIGNISTKKALFLAYNPETNKKLIDAALELGFKPNPDAPLEDFIPRDPFHVTYLSNFLQDDLNEAQIYFQNDEYILVGNKLCIQIGPYESRDLISGETTRTWEVAFCIDVRELRGTKGGPVCRSIPSKIIAVRTRREINQESASILENAQDWQYYLPKIERGEVLRARLARFHDFIRCTNQIELLIRDSELFQYRELRRDKRDQVEVLEVYEIEREARPVLEIIQMEGGMIEFLQREIESIPREEKVKVVLSANNSLRFDPGVYVRPKDCYEVVGFGKQQIVTDEATNETSEVTTVILERLSLQKSLPSAPKEGWLRTFGMFGQVDLIRRRKEAIDRLFSHSYLLKSLCSPGQVCMDTFENRKLIDLPVDQVDDAKQAVMTDILRTRPIYALQGPPGTGKTTLVAHLLKQIFTDDPVAQVLVTAQAHGAVDVLHDKVKREAFAGVPDDKMPLDIRLGKDNEENNIIEGSVQDVAIKILTQSIQAIVSNPDLSLIQKEWYEVAQDMLNSVKTFSLGKDAPEFCELIKRGASIIYCTTSAGDLEELARSTQFYDWSIVEEAGKCHGFDLALPLQAGHRWILIGDHYQLQPYRFEDYLVAIQNLEDVVESLKSLPGRAAGLLDNDWIQRWEAMSPDDRKDFKEYAKGWIFPFRKIYENCSKALGDQKLTIREPIGATAGLLSLQYRMHPLIGDLISKAFYDDQITSMTRSLADGKPLKRVVLGVNKPEAISKKSIVWLDTISANKSNLAREHGPWNNKPRYSNPYEVKVIKGFLHYLELEQSLIGVSSDMGLSKETIKMAILAPYTKQVREIRKEISEKDLPVGVEAKRSLSRRRGFNSDNDTRLVHTVDSFQGNEADIVILSLVRNNLGYYEHKNPLGFLENFQRLNVMLSRAQRLLVLVGSWDFFYQQVELVRNDDENRELYHLKIVMELLSDWFETGQAVKLQAFRFVE